MESRSWHLRMLALAFLACSGSAAAAAAEKPSTVQARAVVVPSQDVEVVSPVTGVIKRVVVKEGKKVTAHQPLVELDADVQKAMVALSEHRAKSTARIEAAQANLRIKQAAYERQKTLHKRGVASDADLEEAELHLRHAEATLTVSEEEQVAHRLTADRDRAMLAERTIRAPSLDAAPGGAPQWVVVRCIQDAGEAAREGEPLVRLVMLDVLHVIAFVSPAAAARLRAGMTAQLELDDEPGGRHPCRILVVDPIVDAASSTCRVKLELPNKEHKVAAGLRGTVSFELAPSPGGARKPGRPTQRRP